MDPVSLATVQIVTRTFEMSDLDSDPNLWGGIIVFVTAGIAATLFGPVAKEFKRLNSERFSYIVEICL